MARKIIILDYEKEKVIKINLSEFDECVIKDRYDGNVEDWLASRYNDDKLFSWCDIHWMAADEIEFEEVSRESRVDDGAFVESVLIDTKRNNCWGLIGSNGEIEIQMKFFDGYAVEVDDEWKELPPEKDPVMMFYPTLDEVNNVSSASEAIEEYTGRKWDGKSIYDIALKFGEIRRRGKYEK